MALEKDGRIIIDPPKNQITQEQRAGFVLIIVVGSLSLILGTLFIFRNVNAPFDISYEGPLFLTSAQQRAIEAAEQQDRDTDGDGLSDYDELYVHRTSPYLSDTDGDGFFDGQEIASGNDPNVSSANALVNIETDTVDPFVDATNDRLSQIPGFVAPTVDQLDSSTTPIDPENVTPAQLRQALIDQGAPPEAVNAFSDEELLTRYYELLEEEQAADLSGDADSETSEDIETQTEEGV